ncbi:hypothetical protein SAMN05216428_101269 [Nitrosospira sp. Nsp11]|nr:hypothetical protein [Nitrosospira sp. Nsp11]SHL15639.1 hypothetical protein SAMN05216428_101269 [Nitrosospira sp. Nsp11]
MDIAKIKDENPDMSDLINIINRRLAANGRYCLKTRLPSGAET